jgi:hypothetical protein
MGVPLPSRCYILYIFSTIVSTEYFEHAAHSLFFSSKCRLFHNATFLVHVFFTFYIEDVQNLNVKFKFCKFVHHRTIQINHQPDASVLQFIILTFAYSSTCFGRFPAHHQKGNGCSRSLWFYLCIVVTVLLHQIRDLFELNVKLWCQNVKHVNVINNKDMTCNMDSQICCELDNKYIRYISVTSHRSTITALCLCLPFLWLWGELSA